MYQDPLLMIGIDIKSMRTTCWLVRFIIYWTIKEGLRNKKVLCASLLCCCQSLVIIGYTSEHFIIWTNQKCCLKASGSHCFTELLWMLLDFYCMLNRPSSSQIAVSVQYSCMCNIEESHMHRTYDYIALTRKIQCVHLPFCYLLSINLHSNSAEYYAV